MHFIFRKDVQRFNAIIGLDRFVSFSREKYTDAVNDLSVVINNQHIHFSFTSAHIVQYIS